MTFYPSYIRAYMLLSYKWDGDGDGDQKSLCGATIRASLCVGNNVYINNMDCCVALNRNNLAPHHGPDTQSEALLLDFMRNRSQRDHQNCSGT